MLRLVGPCIVLSKSKHQIVRVRGEHLKESEEEEKEEVLASVAG